MHLDGLPSSVKVFLRTLIMVEKMSQIEWSEGEFRIQLNGVEAGTDRYAVNGRYCAFCGDQRSTIWFFLPISERRVRICEGCALKLAKALNVNR